MGDTQEHVPGFGVALLDEGLESIAQSFVAGLVPLHYLPDLLVYDQKVVVFVDDAGCYVGIIHLRAKIMTICHNCSGGTAFVIS